MFSLMWSAFSYLKMPAFSSGDVEARHFEHAREIALQKLQRLWDLGAPTTFENLSIREHADELAAEGLDIGEIQGGLRVSVHDFKSNQGHGHGQACVLCPLPYLRDAEEGP
eukprot:CAMPEP_0119470270 /NCGR_PEP_ID=MMETSP1344-20130328/3242_1 /TAXON_ID=236787 /ORGANISM="Florenciella parvula, Strain CCMP2471" /LENGTH=110 /DNA_ID=CAMNT_0007502923 /DNA_START=1 /DNA_END=334 /DNA_ORIENTATION=+